MATKKKKSTSKNPSSKNNKSGINSAEKIVKKISKLSKKQLLILAIVVLVVIAVVVVLYVTHPELFSFLNPPSPENNNGQIGENIAFEAYFIQYSKNTCDFSHGMNCQR